MNLKKKKELAAKTLKVGKNRIHFSEEGLSEIKEAITKQDIKDLFNEGIITIKPIKGRKTIKKRKTKIGPGKRKKRINKRKEEYVKITKKLRLYLKELKKSNAINRELYIELRKKLRNRYFKSKANLKEYLDNPDRIKIDKNKKLDTKNKTKKK
jgi:large subunit ribosomal protein L19e